MLSQYQSTMMMGTHIHHMFLAQQQQQHLAFQQQHQQQQIDAYAAANDDHVALPMAVGSMHGSRHDTMQDTMQVSSPPHHFSMHLIVTV